MFDAKKLTEEQLSAIKDWASQGDQLPDIQKKLEKEFELSMTYMDTRFLILDLGVEIQKPEEEETAKLDDSEEPATQNKTLTDDDMEILPGDGTPAGGGVSVTVDEVVRPGVMVSGKVHFSDGEKGAWYIDQMGRLGIDPDTAGYQPSEQDVAVFQSELKTLMDRH